MPSKIEEQNVKQAANLMEGILFITIGYNIRTDYSSDVIDMTQALILQGKNDRYSGDISKYSWRLSCVIKYVCPNRLAAGHDGPPLFFHGCVSNVTASKAIFFLVPEIKVFIVRTLTYVLLGSNGISHVGMLQPFLNCFYNSFTND